MEILLLTKAEDKLVGLKESAVQVAMFLMQQGHSLAISGDHRNVNMVAYDLAISWYYNRILKEGEFDAPRHGTINIHPSLLPWGKGADPHIYMITQGEPGGVTIHWIDRGLDTGNILARKEVKVLPTDTGWTLYERLEKACVDLFKDFWQENERKFVNGDIPCGTPHGGGSFHYRKDLFAKDDLGSEPELVKILRARTHPDYDGCYFHDYDNNGKKVYIKVELYEEDSDN